MIGPAWDGRRVGISGCERFAFSLVLLVLCTSLASASSSNRVAARVRVSANSAAALSNSSAPTLGSQIKVSGIVAVMKILSQVSRRLLDRGNPSQCTQAELLARHSLSNTEIIANALRPDGPVPRGQSESTLGIAYCLSLRGDYATAELMYRRSIAEQTSVPGTGDSSRSSMKALTNLAILLEAQGRYREAEPLYRRAVAAAEQASGVESAVTGTAVGNLGVFMMERQRYSAAEPLVRRALVIAEHTQGSDSPAAATALNNLATLLLGQGRYAEAEAIYRQSSRLNEQLLGLERAATATGLSNLAFCLYMQQRYAEAQPYFMQALAIRQKVLRPDHPDTIGLRENIALNYWKQKRYGDAVVNYRQSCVTHSSSGSGHDLSADAAQAARLAANRCATNYSLALADWAAVGGGAAPGDRPAALMSEAFGVAQIATLSATNEAIARSAAFTVAQASGVGPDAQAYETALRELDEVDLQFAKLDGNADVPPDVRGRLALRGRDEIVAKLSELGRLIESKAPRFWDYRMSEPVGAAALQARTGHDSVLLRSEEALITVLLPADDSQSGLVFAVSKEKMDWARLGLAAGSINDGVARLRAQLDPRGSDPTRSIQVSRPAAIGPARAFDRRLAYELYRALLGESRIQDVIRDKPVLIFVVNGALTRLPPGLLVSAAPAGDSESGGDADALRNTAWLLRSKAIAMLPGVSSLRTLRQMLPSSGELASDPLLALVDPEFSRHGSVPDLDAGSSFLRSLSAGRSDHAPLQDVLDGLPRLPGTLLEGAAVQQTLGAGPGSVLTGREASKSQLYLRNSDGRLARVRVLDLATHGLVAGDAQGLEEPALVLAQGVQPADSLLVASEAAALRLNADWVILSACNTASPATTGEEGYSGLARAFFYAGARSLVVSHWAVRDDIAPRLISGMLAAQRQDPGLNKAEALRRATLAVLDDPALDAASPAAWAPFTLIGEVAP